MKLTAIMPVRNEDWVLGLSARAVLMWADELLILDHASTDGTMDIVGDLALEYPGKVKAICEVNPVWEEMRHRQRLLELARSGGATHIAIVDADEVVTGNLVPFIRAEFERCPAERTLQLPWICLRNDLGRYHNTGLWSEQYASVGFQDAPGLHWKARNGYDFHHRHPMGRMFIAQRPPITKRAGGLMHLQFLSERRLKAKQALYKMQEIVRWPGRDRVATINQRYDYSIYGCDTLKSKPAAAAATPAGIVPLEWWSLYQRAGYMKHLQPDAEPWQEQACFDLLDKYGTGKFRGLDLYGVVDC